MGQKASTHHPSKLHEVVHLLQRQESLKRQPSVEDSSASDPLLVLPPEVVLLIIDLLPPSTLVLTCRLVCTSWKQLVDEPQLWQLRMKRAHNFEPRLTDLSHVVNWPQLYTNSVARPNLIRSVVDGKLSLQPWYLSATDWSNFGVNFTREKQPEHSWRGGTVGGGDGWLVEEPAWCEMTPELKKENEGLNQCYVTSYGWCCREQWVDLERAGFSGEILDAIQPVIEITEWFGARGDCGSVFNLRVDLLDEACEKQSQSGRTFTFSEVTAQWHGGHWHKVQHQFKDYGKGVRYVRFADGGKDTQFWAGHYGSKMFGACVRIIFS